MARKGLGKGLASLIPDFYNEDFDSNSTQSLEDMLNDNEDADSKTEEEVQIEENISTEDNKIEDEVEENDQKDSEIQTGETPRQGSVNDKVPNKETEVDTNQEDSESEVLSSGKSSEDGIQTTQEIQVNQQHIEEVKEIVNKNPRITLWSSRSSAVFRYLRKTEPEFSISKEASILIDEAVSKKYPEIWKLFEDD